MIQIPGELFLQTLEGKKVYRFIGNPPAGIPNHYHICVSKTGEETIIFACCTSQQDTMNRLIKKHSIPESTIVYIPQGKYKTFPKDTYVNYNDVFPISVDEFIEYYKSGGIEYQEEISLSDYKQIIDGIKESPLVEEETKELIPNID